MNPFLLQIILDDPKDDDHPDSLLTVRIDPDVDAENIVGHYSKPNSNSIHDNDDEPMQEQHDLVATMMDMKSSNASTMTATISSQDDTLSNKVIHQQK